MKKGFTLVELLAVVMIVSILTAVALPQYRRSLERTRVAEALQMLPAVYGSAERLQEEIGCRTEPECRTQVTFPKLDVEMKKGYGETTFAPEKWKTKNFVYTLGWLQTTPPLLRVQAQMRRGSYKGTLIVYDGTGGGGDDSFRCCPGSVSDACDRLNLKAVVGAASMCPSPAQLAAGADL